MAKQKGILKIQGLVDGLSFYPSVHGDIVRRKGGASKEKIKKHPSFKRLREHHTEFANCAAAGKLLRQPLKLFTIQAPDHTLVWRVTKVMNQIKDLDTISDRGKRNVAKGIATTEAKQLLNGFDLNSKAHLKTVLKQPVKAGAGKLSIAGLVPKRDLTAPKGATHVAITGIVSVIDFAASIHTLNYKTITLALDRTAQDIAIHPAPSKNTGTVFYLLQLQFLQEVNGVQHTLANKEGNAFAIVKVG